MNTDKSNVPINVAQEILPKNELPGFGDIVDLTPDAPDAPQLRAVIEPTAEQLAEWDIIDPDFAATLALNAGASLSRCACFRLDRRCLTWENQPGVAGHETGWRRFDLNWDTGEFLALGPDDQTFYIAGHDASPRQVTSLGELLELLAAREVSV